MIGLRTPVVPILSCLCLLCFTPILAEAQQGPVQDNPVLAPNTLVPPVIDGVGDDACWQNIPWQSIEQVWIPYGTTVSPEDYSGRYKVVWSSTTNLLYFLVEIHDDVFVDGFIPGATADVYNFDIVEVFIDENKSGGLHIFDGTPSGGTGTNAENAFSYHIYADLPSEGGVTTQCYVGDLDGTSWSDSRGVNYASHFPEFAYRTSGTTALREFSLIVYNDTYEEGRETTARSQLQVDKVMGLSLAYCDNDDPDENPKQRDKFFGSVWVPAEAYNDHWMNADGFGTIRLGAEIPTGIREEHSVPKNPVRFFPNPASSSSQLRIDNSYRGSVQIRVFNLLGQEVSRLEATKTESLFACALGLKQLPPGPYFIQTRMGQAVYNEKLIVAP